MPVDLEKLRAWVEKDKRTQAEIGGEAANMHKANREKKIRGRGSVGKKIVHGLLERGKTSTVRAKVVESTEATTPQPQIVINVERGAAVYTDAHKAYLGLADRFLHEVVDHATEYVRA